MKNSITLIRVPYEEPFLLNLIIRATNGKQAAELEFYDNAECLSTCANALSDFPQNAMDSFTWELGSEDPKDNYAFFFRFKVYMLNYTGRCAINLRFNNNEKDERLAISDFCLEAEPAGLNNLGRLFRSFAEFKMTTLHWNGQDGELS